MARASLPALLNRLAAVLFLVGAWLLVTGLRGDQHSLVEPVVPHPALTVSSGRAPAVRVAPAARSVPVLLRIPAIGVSVHLSALGLRPDRTVQVPSDFREAGWFRLGPTPGQLGSAVILGHVDSYKGPAVFFRVRALQVGDRVDVTLADGVVTHFAVRLVAMYPKDRFPARLVYGSRGFSDLQLVTCGGAFDRHLHSYRSNVVAYTSLVSTSSAS